jgi:hypothetical protein
VRQPFLRDDCNLHDAIVVLDERSTVDKARQRFADNVALLTKHDPELAVMGDRDWTNACTNEFIQHMAKVLWMRDYTEQDVLSVTKAVKGYLLVLRRKAEAEPMIPGGRIIHGEICTVRQHCDHGPSCQKHWRMNVRDYTHKNTIYTPIPYGIMQMYEPKDLVGMSVKYYAHISVSERDNTFGFAHRPKLMEVERKES